jgi:flagellar protein FliS
MMYSQQNKAARYQSVKSQGLVMDASPARLVQIMFEHILTQLATAQGCMRRIQGNLPLHEVRTKCATVGKAVRVLNHLDSTLDMERGGGVARNLHDLYLYMMNQLTIANARNDAARVDEVISLVRTVKAGWDQLVKDGR